MSLVIIVVHAPQESEIKSLRFACKRIIVEYYRKKPVRCKEISTEQKEMLNYNVIVADIWGNPENEMVLSSCPPWSKRAWSLYQPLRLSVIGDRMPLEKSCDLRARWLSAVFGWGQFLLVRGTYLRVLCCQHFQKSGEWMPQAGRGVLGDASEHPTTAVFLQTLTYVRFTCRVF